MKYSYQRRLAMKLEKKSKVEKTMLLKLTNEVQMRQFTTFKTYSSKFKLLSINMFYCKWNDVSFKTLCHLFGFINQSISITYH